MLIPEQGPSSGFDVIQGVFRCVVSRFAFARLSHSYMPWCSTAFPVTFTTAVFRSEAAYGCLKPVPTNRLRRAILHLRYSIALLSRVHGTRSPNPNYRPGDPWMDTDLVLGRSIAINSPSKMESGVTPGSVDAPGASAGTAVSRRV